MANSPIRSNVYSAAHFALELDGGKELSLFRSIEGGGVKADVMTYQFGANDANKSLARWKMLGKPKFDDIKVQVGMSMSWPLYKWIEKFFKGEVDRKNGAILAADFYYIERARRSFYNAMIKELTFPKLEASDKSAAYMTVAIAAEGIEFLKGSGNKLPLQATNFDKQKLWTACNYEFSLGTNGPLADACKRVTKIDSFTIKQNIIEHHVGTQKAPIKTPSWIEFPNITFYVPEIDAQPFYDWMGKRVGFGPDNGNGTVRSPTDLHGVITCLDTTLADTLFEIALEGCDIVSITPDKLDAGSEELKQVKVELHTEGMKFKWAGLE